MSPDLISFSEPADRFGYSAAKWVLSAYTPGTAFNLQVKSQNGELAKADEGMAYVCVDYGSDEKFSLRMISGSNPKYV